MKKIFVDIYLALNLGDDLFLEILAKRFPNCEFTLNYVGRKYDKFISQYKNIVRKKYSLFDKIYQQLKLRDSITNYKEVAEKHDALIFIGGSIFREEDYDNFLYGERVKIISEFKEKSKPVFILGANFGPFKTKKFLMKYKELFKMCDDVCFRDLYSFNLFKTLPQVRYAPDIVFQLNVNDYNRLPQKKMVGYSIIDVRHKQGLSKYYYDYINNTVKSIELMNKKGYKCYLMSFCEKEGDLTVINKIKSHLSKEVVESVSIYNYKGNIKEALSLIASFKLFIAARFHANILALIFGIGVIPVIYSEKTTNVLRDLNHIDILIEMDKLNMLYDEEIINQSFNNIFKLNLSNTKDQFYEINKFIQNSLVKSG